MKGGIAPIYGFPREMASRSDSPGRLARRVEVSPPGEAQSSWKVQRLAFSACRIPSRPFRHNQIGAS
jgi:hypothetical protein